MELTAKITRRAAAGVARRLKLAASVRSRSMSAMVNDALDQALPSLEEIRMQLAAPAGAAEAGWLGDFAANGHPGPVHAAAGRGDEPGLHGQGGRGGDDRGRP